VAGPPRVVVLGGGFAGLESAFLLRHRLHDAVDLTLVSDRPSFLFRPNTIYIPFGAEPDELEIPLAGPAARKHIAYVAGEAGEIDADGRSVALADGRAIPYDFLVVATGAAMRPAEIDGLAEHAVTVWTPADMLALRARIEGVVARARRGERTRVLFLIPPNNKCAGPLYEIVFMVETHLRRERARDAVDLVWATAEQTYIQAFGPKLHEVVTTEFAERGIEGRTQLVAERVEQGLVRFTDGTSLGYDELVSFPPYVARVAWDGLPADDRGFLHTVADTRQVAGQERIFAPGDAGDFPVKQAFLAFLQADAVAEHIAGLVDGREPRSAFDPVSMCIMEMFDKATFAQVPLRLTGDPARPVEVRPDANGAYKVGVSPIWRLGKKMLGAVVPMRFHAGEPFHAGTAWQLMDIGLRGMKGVLAD
jgi:NADH dehydrogenase FAD-containing subunit